VPFVGLAPDFVSIYQVVIRVPEDARAGR
jgi:hypothetical protein